MKPRSQGPSGALNVLRRGLTQSPEFRTGFWYTVGLSILIATATILIPILIQQILDKGLRGGFRASFVYPACVIAAVMVAIVYVGGRITHFRMVRASQTALANLRVKVFAHVHRLSIGAQTTERRAAFTTRVTSDIETLAEFMEWGALTWVRSTTLMVGVLAAMLVYSVRLTLIVVVFLVPLALVMKRLQRGLLSSYDEVRDRVSETLTEVSESVMGAAVIRAYGLGESTDRRLKSAIRRQYRAQIRANRYMAILFPIGDIFGALATAAVLVVGVTWGPGWGMSSGELIAFMFLAGLFLEPMAELSETFDQTQTAIAGWRKVLGVLDTPVDIVEPTPGITLPRGSLEVRTEQLSFAYEDGIPVLRGVDVVVRAAASVAVVGETGCGKTTFAKLLSRLADPSDGRILVGGQDLREIAPESRRAAIRMVPQDGFLFDTTVEQNVLFGSPSATTRDVEKAFDDLGLLEWVRGLPDGLSTVVGQRGTGLSVGEAQFVALARAQIGDPGVLILDEATSSVDPESERALTEAMQRVSRGRTTITIAHRLSTAEGADFVLVFDRGRIVEQGEHAGLVARGGVYASLYRSWLGNVRAA